MLVSGKKVKGTVIEVSGAFEYLGTLKLRVKTGSCEVFGRTLGVSDEWTRLT